MEKGGRERRCKVTRHLGLQRFMLPLQLNEVAVERIERGGGSWDIMCLGRRVREMAVESCGKGCKANLDRCAEF